MRIRKTVTTVVPAHTESETNVQGRDDTNREVGILFSEKSTLASVTLAFEDGSSKLYERV